MVYFIIRKGESHVKIQNIIEDVLIGCGITISLIDIQQVLSIILLVFNVLWILWKFGFKVYTHIKNKKYEEIGNDIKDAKDEFEQITQKTNDDSDKM